MDFDIFLSIAQTPVQGHTPDEEEKELFGDQLLVLQYFIYLKKVFGHFF